MSNWARIFFTSARIYRYLSITTNVFWIETFSNKTHYDGINSVSARCRPMAELCPHTSTKYRHTRIVIILVNFFLLKEYIVLFIESKIKYVLIDSYIDSNSLSFDER